MVDENGLSRGYTYSSLRIVLMGGYNITGHRPCLFGLKQATASLFARSLEVWRLGYKRKERQARKTSGTRNRCGGIEWVYRANKKESEKKQILEGTRRRAWKEHRGAIVVF